MYLIAKGACEVSIIDEKKNRQRLKTLRPSDYFGEISMIYDCKRTATVTSMKYSTLAMLKKDFYKEILIEFPNLQEQLKKSIFQYKDRMKRFIINSIMKIEYFQNIGDDAVHDIIYSLKGKKFNKGEILQAPGDNATSLFFLQDGVIEVYTHSESSEFVLEKLFRGSIINHRTFFKADDGKVFFRFARNSICFELQYEMLEEILPRHPKLKK
jgi:CRP-like cAMP-binding protein